MTSSVIISKDALSFTNSNDIIVSKMESNSEGNIDISGILMGDFSGNLTGAVSSAAQTSITSVGTLSNLKVSGNVGVGTTGPSAKLEVVGDISCSTGININNEVFLNPAGGGRTSTTSTIYRSGSLYMTSTNGIVLTTKNEGALHMGSPVDNDIMVVKCGGSSGSGRVGIGTTSPEASLDIKGGGTFPTFVSQGIRMGLNGVARSGESSNSQDLAFIAPSALNVGYMSSIWFASANRSLQTTTSADGWIRYKHSNDGSLQFGVNGETRVRVMSTGNVGIGTTSPSAKLHVHAGNGNYYFYGGPTFSPLRMYTAPGGSHYPFHKFYVAHAHAGFEFQNDYSATKKRLLYISRNGNVTINGTYSPSSDNRIKHNEEDISNALITINKLKPQFYIRTVSPADFCGNEYPINHNFTANDLSNGLPEDTFYDSGYIAQDVSNIAELNHLVSGSEYDASGNPTALALNYTGIQPYLTKAVQELHALVLEQRQQILDLSAQVASLS